MIARCMHKTGLPANGVALVGRASLGTVKRTAKQPNKTF
jgi:hypothetical protein